MPRRHHDYSNGSASKSIDGSVESSSSCEVEVIVQITRVDNAQAKHRPYLFDNLKYAANQGQALFYLLIDVKDDDYPESNVRLRPNPNKDFWTLDRITDYLQSISINDDKSFNGRLLYHYRSETMHTDVSATFSNTNELQELLTEKVMKIHDSNNFPKSKLCFQS